MMHSARYRNSNKRSPKISAELCAAMAAAAASGAMAALQPGIAAAEAERSIQVEGGADLADVSPGALLPPGQTQDVETISAAVDRIMPEEECEAPTLAAYMSISGRHKILAMCDEAGLDAEVQFALSNGGTESTRALLRNVATFDPNNRSHLLVRHALILERQLKGQPSPGTRGLVEDPEVREAFKSIGIDNDRLIDALINSREGNRKCPVSTTKRSYDLPISEIMRERHLSHESALARVGNCVLRALVAGTPRHAYFSMTKPFFFRFMDSEKIQTSWLPVAIYSMADMSDLLGEEAIPAPSTSAMVEEALQRCRSLASHTGEKGGKRRFLNSLSRICTAVDWNKLFEEHLDLHGALGNVLDLIVMDENATGPVIPLELWRYMASKGWPIDQANEVVDRHLEMTRVYFDLARHRSEDPLILQAVESACSKPYGAWADAFAQLLSKVAAEIPEDCLHSKDVKERVSEFYSMERMMIYRSPS